MLKTILGEEPSSQPDVVYDHFWRQINENYSGLSVRLVNWDSLDKIYRPQVNAQTPTSTLIAIFKAMLLPFGDHHLGFKAGNIEYYPSGPDTIPNYLGLSVVEKGLKTTLKNYSGLYHGRWSKRRHYAGTAKRLIVASSFKIELFTRQDSGRRQGHIA